jgi:hypothetical protein
MDKKLMGGWTNCSMEGCIENKILNGWIDGKIEA